MPLRSDERLLLLRLARQAVSVAAGAPGASKRLSGSGTALAQELTSEPASFPAALREPAGVFVTLHKYGELRGCVGLVERRLPLYRAVIETAAGAALRDPRFPPVRAEELPALDIELSVLSPLQRLAPPINPALIAIGTHGLIVTQGQIRGLLLPQVAVERGWSPERFLEETCRKAGLPPDAWQSGARVEVFSAAVFGEVPEQRP